MDITRGPDRLLMLTIALALTASCTSERKPEPAAASAAPSASAPPTVAPAASGSTSAAPPLRYLASLDAAERQDLYHLPEGGELLPLDFLYAVDSSATFKPFMADLNRFRLIPDPADPDGLPVGMSATIINGKRSTPREVFFNCAACHTTDVHYQSKVLRVEGAPSHFDMAGFVIELLESLENTITTPAKLEVFLKRLAERRHGAGKSAVVEAYPDLALSESDPEPAMLGKVTALIERDKARAGSEVAKVKLDLATAEDVLHLAKAKIAYLKGLRGLRTTTAAGFGRLDAFMAARDLLFGEKLSVDVNSPVSLPPIFGLTKLTWYHYDNNTNSIAQRNIGEDLGVGAVANTKTGESTVLVKNLRQLEQTAAKLPIPRWPEDVLGKIDAQRAARGAAIYKTECASCHDAAPDGMFPDRTYDLATIGTDPNRALNFAKPLGATPFAAALGGVLDKVEKKAIEREGMTPDEAAKLEPTKVEWRATGKYSSRPLGGVWVTAPYLHNGSVPTLHDLLLPPEQRPKTFLTGSREYDPKKVGYVTDGSQGATFLFDTAADGNHNTGHTYGTTLPEEQRLDLLEYLKSL